MWQCFLDRYLRCATLLPPSDDDVDDDVDVVDDGVSVAVGDVEGSTRWETKGMKQAPS